MNTQANTTKPKDPLAVALVAAVCITTVAAIPLAAGWVWGTYHEQITHALATGQQAVTTYAQATLRALWHMSNLLG